MSKDINDDSILIFRWTISLKMSGVVDIGFYCIDYLIQISYSMGKMGCFLLEPYSLFPVCVCVCEITDWVMWYIFLQGAPGEQSGIFVMHF